MGRIIPLFEAHAAAWDAEFRRIRDRFAGQMRCGRGCAACCSQMFSISALEAAAVSNAVADLPAGDRERLLARAREYVEDAACRGLLESRDEEAGLIPRPGVRIPCPALHEDACSIYAARPLICRKWGIPVFDPAKPDRLHACELNFRAGDVIEAGDIVSGQTALLTEWVQLKNIAAADGDLPDRRSTVAEAILAHGAPAHPS